MTPRQNGKSQLIVARALAGVLLFGEKTIICSAHQTDTAREVFQRLLDVIDDNPSVSKRVESVMKALNPELSLKSPLLMVASVGLACFIMVIIGRRGGKG